MNPFINKKRLKVVKFVSVLILLTCASVVSAQNPSIEWQKNYGGSNRDHSWDVKQTSDGGYVIAGFSVSDDIDLNSNQGVADSWILKIDSVGNQEWNKSLGGSLNDVAYSIQQTADGGYVMAGYTASNDGDVSNHKGKNDYWVVKLSSIGSVEWNKCLGGSENDVAFSIQQTTDHGFVVAGYSYSSDGDVDTNKGNNDYWIVKLDSLGGIIWNKSLGGTDYDNALSIQQTTNGGYIVVGNSLSINGDVDSNHGNHDSWIVKLNPLGSIVWSKCFGGTNREDARSVQQTADGGYIVAGASYSNNGDVAINYGGRDGWVFKLSSNGNIEWEKSLGGTHNDYINSIQQTADGGYIVAGNSSSDNGDLTSNQGSEDYWVIKLNSTGNIEGQKSVGGDKSDVANFIRQTADGGFIATGFTSSNNGDVTNNYGDDDYWVIKFLPIFPNSIEHTTINEPLLLINPNPVRNELNITSNLNITNLQIYDIQGRSQLSLSGNIPTKINTTDLVCGIYFIRLETSKGIIEQKFIKK